MSRGVVTRLETFLKKEDTPGIPREEVVGEQQAVIVNGKLPSSPNRQNASLTVQKTHNDLIDLTDEEERTKVTIAATIPLNTATVIEAQNTALVKAQPRYQRVLQTIPASVAIASQQASIRLVPPNQPTPTALVNNMNASRVTYVMQGGIGSTRQLLITSNPNQIRPVTSGSRAPFSAVAYKTGISTVANGTVRLLTTPANTLFKHPAPLPDCPNYPAIPNLKLPPPAPSLKISKVTNGIVLSWNMTLSDKYAEIASYQLYAYQETVGTSPSTTLWKKVGDVRALPLPMACTLTQFSEGNNYYFAVRAVDTHSRLGQYSIPGNISL
ncbi:activating transcription factor 7-interacting protein 1-like [Orussus abietinus]|uniref:activating transcription factor 7-interacting protein 1-like n=1 Tax=Orussus abietinus TaxID=222816 RepID=UPI000C715CAF|nr:activating transcription factor 7-interacting protein 1-like [Orussus abietinus]